MFTKYGLSFDVVIVGGGMVGLCLAQRLLDRDITRSIAILDKEPALGAHSSGRNSGVLHAGLYYKPNSLKAKVCVSGANRLRQWVIDRNLPLNTCGKVIVPHKLELDTQLDILAERGRANGASVEFLDEHQLSELEPSVFSSSGRALWSPNTCVVKPLTIVKQLQSELTTQGVKFFCGELNWTVYPHLRSIRLSDNSSLSYSHFINSAGLNSDRIAHLFDIGLQYFLIPFKGLYWQLKSSSPVKPSTNIYPVPDLNVPFLGVHFTPSADSTSIVSIGPTATLAWGRENYRAFNGIELYSSLKNIGVIANQYLSNRGGFRRYVHEQAFLSIPPFLVNSARQLIPSLKAEYIELSQKVGIRSQLFNTSTNMLEDDFICLHGANSTHVMNAISPAFTASFALADLILDSSVNHMS